MLGVIFILNTLYSKYIPNIGGNYMKHYITEKEWAALEEILMRAEIPYNVTWDSHVHESLTEVTHDKYIRIEPIIIQRTMEVK